MSKALGALLFSCAMSLAACDAVDPSDDDPAGPSAEDLEDPAEMSEDDVARLTTEFEPEVSGPQEIDLLDYRYYLSWGDCHTYWWMADQAALYCQAIGSHYSYNYNFTYGCRGWWGDGARKVWFSCGRFN